MRDAEFAQVRLVGDDESLSGDGDENLRGAQEGGWNEL
jgi:hypothetical protein